MANVPAVGIDLGTTNSCIGVLTHGKVEIIANEQGNRTTPSTVAFTETERLIGDPAKIQAALNSRNTVFNTKRLIGMGYNDEKIQQDIKNWPFTVVNDNGKPKIEVEFKGEKKIFTPEEIGAMVLSKMKTIAEIYLDGTVRDAVITVPAYFNDNQRQATKDAGTIAGLNVLRIISEPTAAALAYGLEKNLKGELQRNVLVFDLGGGTFDVSILTIREGLRFEVKSTAGDTHLGGEDFDNLLVDYFVQEFKRKYKKDISGNPRSIRRLRTAAERAKTTLSSATEATLAVEALFEGIDFHTKISRARFEELCMTLFQGTLATVEEALVGAGMAKDTIDDVVLVGGSTRIPKVQAMLREFFDDKHLNVGINPDEAVAYGAAIQAAILTNNTIANMEQMVVADVTPLSLGVDLVGGVMSKIIERNTPIPCQNTEKYFTIADNQSRVKFNIYQGERPMVNDNILLGSLNIDGIPPGPRGTRHVYATFALDLNGILSVTVKEPVTGNSTSIKIDNENSRLSKGDIDRMMADALLYKKEDERKSETVKARNKLEEYIYIMNRATVNAASALTVAEKSVLRDRCSKAKEWMERNLLAEKIEYEDKLAELKQICEPYLEKLTGLNQTCKRLNSLKLKINETD